MIINKIRTMNLLLTFFWSIPDESKKMTFNTQIATYNLNFINIFKNYNNDRNNNKKNPCMS